MGDKMQGHCAFTACFGPVGKPDALGKSGDSHVLTLACTHVAGDLATADVFHKYLRRRPAYDCGIRLCMIAKHASRQCTVPWVTLSMT